LEGDEYDGTPEKLKGFLDRLQQKAEDYTWLESVLTIPVDPGPPVISRNLIDDYGNISLEQVRAHAATYVGAAAGSRQWQNSHQLKTCLFDSLTTDFQNRVTLEKDKWHVENHPDGACLLKVVISLAYIDTQATSAFIRTELTRMDTKITSLNFDIKKFNGWVKGQVAALAARGETTSDLIVNLFKGYEAVPDRVFKDYIEQKKSAYEEGGTINPEELMQLAQNKFEGRVLAKTWNAPTDEQEQIIALEARIERLQEQKRNLSKRKPQGTRSVQQKNSNSQQKKKPTGNKKKDGRDNEYMTATGKWAWLKVPPKQNKTKKMVERKEFFWCKKHARWGRHATSKCRLTTTKSESKNSGSSKNHNQQDPKLRFTESLEAILEGQDDEDEE
jgi:hypothetical protein